MADVNERINQLIREHEEIKNISLTDEQKELVKYGYTVALLDSTPIPLPPAVKALLDRPRLTKRTSSGIAYMAIADTLPKREQELEGSRHILEGLYAIFQKLADYEDRDAPLKPREHYHWGDFSDEEKKEHSRWFCGRCGWKLAEEINFCGECGQRVDWS